MSLFAVPGWSVPTAPVGQSSKKRKRSVAAAKNTDGSDEAQLVQAAQKNIEKLMQSLGAGADALDDEGHTDKPAKMKRARRQKRLQGTEIDASTAPVAKGKSQSMEQRRQATGRREKKSKLRLDQESKNERAVTIEAAISPSGPEETSNPPRTKSNKRKRSKVERQRRDSVDAHSEAESMSVPINASSTSQGPFSKKSTGKVQEGQPGLTALQATMKKSLDGARFRWINEMLYKSESSKAHEVMNKDPAIFADYHTGFRHQVESWPTNPVSHYISVLSSYPAKTVIADLGCGEAALARALVPKGKTVLSFDLISDNSYVIEADTCVRVPLPGSEGQPGDSNTAVQGEGQVVDVVVCALSLMGTNWPGCIREAWRVLRADGELKIAEVTSRFADVDDFISYVSSFGFQLKNKDERNTHFTLFEFSKMARKVKSDKDWKKLLSRGDILKPCEYKRR